MSERAVSHSRSVSDVFKEFSQLSIGDYVVHERHGIAIYDGLINIEVSGICHDFLVLIFRNDDRLYVPVEDISLVSRYGDENLSIELDSLKKGERWSNRRDTIRKKLLIIANNLLQLEAKRKLLKIEPYTINKQEYEEFCKGFGYVETDDQRRAIADVISDMQGSVPMDRLVCGDVGFGKTEVALRAAFVAISNGKQVALLAPTTILVAQHFKTFLNRFAEFGVKICQLSRFVTNTEFARNVTQIKNGEIQIVIGTHALLSSRIKFAELGLVIIDEEHHFGVKQKENLRRISQAHFLTLSATPIPRTLQLAMTGIRELSLLTKPPVDRLPVKTIICEFEEADIRPAIEMEIQRGGQVFFVVPRVEYLDRAFQFLREIVPDIRIDRIHGQSQNLDKVIEKFYNQEIDILVSTNIIDSGIDIPKANTILIYRFDLFGLSQLYQLRGRVGRSGIQAFAYFLVQAERELSQGAQRRLELMQSLDKLGSGFTLASHDLDIRGAGNLIGEEQSGYIKEVGIELYQSMLKEAVLMVKAGRSTPFERFDSQISLGVSTLIPESYIADQNVRLMLYRRIGGITDNLEFDLLYAEIWEKFGSIPPELDNLFILIKIQLHCKAANIVKLAIGSSGLTFSFYKNRCKDAAILLQYLQSDELKDANWVPKIRSDHTIVMIKKWKRIEDRTRDVLDFTQNLHATLDQNHSE